MQEKSSLHFHFKGKWDYPQALLWLRFRCVTTFEAVRGSPGQFLVLLSDAGTQNVVLYFVKLDLFVTWTGLQLRLS